MSDDDASGHAQPFGENNKEPDGDDKFLTLLSGGVAAAVSLLVAISSN